MPKDYKEFLQALEDDIPNKNWPETLKALWYDAKGDWEAAHNIAQEMRNGLGSWMHAYLHRKEGDKFNARYWYRQVGRSYPNISFQEEHEEMVNAILPIPD